jgi:hypothetical protein
VHFVHFVRFFIKKYIPVVRFWIDLHGNNVCFGGRTQGKYFVWFVHFLQLLAFCALGAYPPEESKSSTKNTDNDTANRGRGNSEIEQQLENEPTRDATKMEISRATCWSDPDDIPGTLGKWAAAH